jgi:hypothetical protein
MARLVTRNGKLLRLPSGALGRGGSVNYEYTNCEAEDLYVYEVCATYTCQGEAIESIDLSEGGTITNVTSPTTNNGTVAITGGGTTLTYTPDPAFTGIDEIDYVLNGVTNRSRYAVVNALPTTVADSAVVESEAPTEIDVLNNDSGNNDRGLSITSVTDPANGTAVIINDGKSIQYTSDVAYTGADTFDYTVSDGLCEATETVTIDVVGFPVADCSAQIGNCSNPYVAGQCPQMVMTVTGAGPGTVNWCGEAWVLPGESGVEKAICPDQYFGPNPFPFNYTHRWRHSAGIFMRRSVSGYLSGTVPILFSAFNQLTVYPSGTLTSFYRPSYNGTCCGNNPYTTSQLGGLITGVPKPTLNPFKWYLTDTSALPIISNTYVSTNATFEWKRGAYWS